MLITNALQGAGHWASRQLSAWSVMFWLLLLILLQAYTWLLIWYAFFTFEACYVKVCSRCSASCVDGHVAERGLQSCCVFLVLLLKVHLSGGDTCCRSARVQLPSLTSF